MPTPTLLELAAMPAVDVRDFLVDNKTTSEISQALMRHLQVNKPAAFNSVLCYLSDIACYCNRGSCFEDSVPPEDIDKYFVSVPLNSELVELPGYSVGKLYDSLASAEADAVKCYGLAESFFGEPVAA